MFTNNRPCTSPLLLDTGCAASSKVIQDTEVGGRVVGMSGNVVEQETISTRGSLSGNEVSLFATGKLLFFN